LGFFGGGTAGLVEGQVAHDAVQVAGRVANVGIVLLAAEAQPRLLHHIFGAGAAADDRRGIVKQCRPVGEVELEFFVRHGVVCQRVSGAAISPVVENHYQQVDFYCQCGPLRG